MFVGLFFFQSDVKLGNKIKNFVVTSVPFQCVGREEGEREGDMLLMMKEGVQV